MKLNHDICYKALRTRDGRFDGRFFTGVKSTGIYCRPVCPARTPRGDNCVFFACAAAAEEAGFRACRRCRPETSPGTPAWRGTSATVDRAMRLIAEGALDGGNVVDLAVRLGVGDRHLRRLFAEQLGASPRAVALTRRVHFAKRLICETHLSMQQIALASGFQNARRFNAAVKRTFQQTPTEIRRGLAARSALAGNGTVALRLSFREPYAWTTVLSYLAGRAIPGVEAVADGVYRRTVEVKEFQGLIEVTREPGPRSCLLLRVPVAAVSHLARISSGVRRVFDLDADPEAIFAQLGRDKVLKQVMKRRPGLRVPGAWNRFELAVRAILGQQITVAGASRLAGRLAERFGRRLPSAATVPGFPDRFFPGPQELVDADIAGVGIPRTRAETIRRLARAVCDGEPVLELSADLQSSVERLTRLPGIGDWTAQYIAMRALQEPDAFPAGDLGLRKALATGSELPTTRNLRQRAEVWRPWRAYAAQLLWNSGKD